MGLLKQTLRYFVSLLCISSLMYPATIFATRALYLYNDRDLPQEFRWHVPNSTFEAEIVGWWAADFATMSQDLDEAGQIAYWKAGLMGLHLSWSHAWDFYSAYDLTTFAKTHNTTWRAVNIVYHNTEWAWVLGQFVPDFGMENNILPPTLPFVNLSLPVLLFAPPFGLGSLAAWQNNYLNIAASILGPSINETSTIQNNTPVGGAINIIFSPIHTDTRAVHSSISVWSRSVDTGQPFQLRTTPELPAPGIATAISTSTIQAAQATSTMDTALAGVYGPLSGSVEYLQDWVIRTAENPTLSFNGYLAEIAYFLTGESELYNFKAGSIVGITPVRHRYGAWQLACRYSGVNLSDQEVQGGSAQTFTVGVNWYPIAYLIVKTNYTRAHATAGFQNDNPNANIAVVEIQTVF